MSAASEFEAANTVYAAAFDKGEKVIVLACMDARLDPAKALGLSEGDAHVIRNAGGRAADAIRSVIISQQLLGTREIVVVHHKTDCGMLTFTDDILRSKVKEELSEDADHIAFLPFADLKRSVLDDIKALKKSSLILDVPVSGFVYDVKTGQIQRVQE
ncbi:hypothetical protein K4F52_001835 [Lecanicillium sp. MT-2017a]|nr:hypothetical protein K4F52_001835 [Lecanicillium sp. MT-2017a]